MHGHTYIHFNYTAKLNLSNTREQLYDLKLERYSLYLINKTQSALDEYRILLTTRRAKINMKLVEIVVAGKNKFRLVYIVSVRFDST